MDREAAYALPLRTKAVILAGPLAGLLLAALDQTIVASAAPAIAGALEVPARFYPWMTMAYLLTSTVFIPIWGNLADVHGRRPVLIAGIGIFVGASALCGAATGVVTLLATRAIQGVGAGALLIAVFTVSADLFPPAERGRYTGVFGAVFAASSVIGPLVGGLLTDHVGWRWVFLVNVPVGAIALALVLARMPRLGGLPAGARRPPIDVAGAVALVACIVPLVVALSIGPGEAGGGTRWTSTPVLALLAIAAGAAVVFAAIERSAAAPLLPMAALRRRDFARATVANFLASTPFLATSVFLPLFAVSARAASATSAGLLLVPLTLSAVVANILAGQIVSRLRRTRAVLAIAIALVAVAYGVMAAVLAPGLAPAALAAILVAIGAGVGPPLPVFVLALQSAAPVDQLGAATASARFTRQLGSILGAAILTTVFTRSVGGAQGALPGAAVVEGVRSVYLTACGMAAVALIATLAMPEIALRGRAVAPPTETG